MYYVMHAKLSLQCAYTLPHNLDTLNAISRGPTVLHTLDHKRASRQDLNLESLPSIGHFLAMHLAPKFALFRHSHLLAKTFVWISKRGVCAKNPAWFLYFDV